MSEFQTNIYSLPPQPVSNSHKRRFILILGFPSLKIGIKLVVTGIMGEGVVPTNIPATVEPITSFRFDWPRRNVKSFTADIHKRDVRDDLARFEMLSSKKMRITV